MMRGVVVNLSHRLNLPILVLFIFGAASFPVYGQIEVDLSSTKPEYLLYEPIDIKVKLTNISSEPLDMARMAKEESWLEFYVRTLDDEEVDSSGRTWIPAKTTLLPGQIKTLSVNLLPLFLIRETGVYRVAVQVKLQDKQWNSPTIRFSVVNGSVIWKQNYVAPPDLKDPNKKPRPRFYSLLIHQTNQATHLYAQIQNPEEQRIFCCTFLGNILNYGEPHARVDFQGNLHIFHQSGTRTFNYTRFTSNGKLLGTRFFSNISSIPKMVTLDKGETEIVGGEEIFISDQKEQVIPTPPLAKPPAN